MSKLNPMKKIAFFAFAILMCLTSSARVTSFGDIAEYGIINYGEDDPLAINPYTWEVFIGMDAEKIFGVNDEHYSVLKTEYNSAFVQEGMKTGQNAFIISFSDRGAFFGGDGYFELAAELPTGSKWAQQYFFLGGWKYNLNEFFHIDIGGNFKYSSKRVSGPGLTGAGIYFSGDIYVGIIANVFLSPFVYYMYNPDYDAQKIMVGINPQFPLEKIVGIKNLAFELEAYYGYVDSNRWTGDNAVNGRYWKNSYGFVQIEGEFVYVINHWRFSIGGGYAYNSDNGGIDGVSSGSEQNVWISTSIGFIF